MFYIFLLFYFTFIETKVVGWSKHVTSQDDVDPIVIIHTDWICPIGKIHVSMYVYFFKNLKSRQDIIKLNKTSNLMYFYIWNASVLVIIYNPVGRTCRLITLIKSKYRLHLDYNVLQSLRMYTSWKHSRILWRLGANMKLKDRISVNKEIGSCSY